MVVMSKKQFPHNNRLTFLERFYIENELNKSCSNSLIAAKLHRAPSTISNEILRNSTITYNHSPSIFPGCRCCYNNDCFGLFDAPCPTRDNPPYICNKCPCKNVCHLTKRFYYAIEAQRKSEI